MTTCSTSIPARFLQQLARDGLIDEEVAQDVVDTSNLLRNIEIIWHMTVRDRGRDAEVTTAMERSICLACEQESIRSLATHAREAAGRAVERIERLLAAI